MPQLSPPPRTLPIVAPPPAPSAPPGAGPDAGPDARPAPPDPTRPDLGPDDLPALLAAFYDAVGRDALLAPYFAPLDMAAHLPRIASFWATVLFHTGGYHGNAFRPHLALAGLAPAHFARWLAAFEAAVDARHAGPHAERTKAAAHRIAYSMQLRLGVAPAAGA